MILTVLGRGEDLIDQTYDSITTLFKKDHTCRSTTYLLSGDFLLMHFFYLHRDEKLLYSRKAHQARQWVVEAGNCIELLAYLYTHFDAYNTSVECSKPFP